jgi:hypothetical protein
MQFTHMKPGCGVVLLCCSCDGGRVCRPLIICDNGVPRVTTGHINKLKAGEWGFTDFLTRGEQGRGGAAGSKAVGRLCGSM